MSGCYPDGVNQSDIDRAIQCERCADCGRELDGDRCDWCRDHDDPFWSKVDAAIEEQKDAEPQLQFYHGFLI